MQPFDGSRAEPFFSLGRCFPIEEVFLDWARQIHKENPVVDAHFDLAAEPPVIYPGYYSVKGDFALAAKTEKSALCDLTPQGLWFYRGSATYLYEFSHPRLFHIILELHAKRTIVPSICKASIDF